VSGNLAQGQRACRQNSLPNFGGEGVIEEVLIVANQVDRF
jgi:hypothetical protein